MARALPQRQAQGVYEKTKEADNWKGAFKDKARINAALAKLSEFNGVQLDVGTHKRKRRIAHRRTGVCFDSYAAFSGKRPRVSLEKED